MSGLGWTEQDCGCLGLVWVNDGDVGPEIAKDIAKQVRAGRVLHTGPNLPPLRCPEHQAARNNAKAATPRPSLWGEL